MKKFATVVLAMLVLAGRPWPKPTQEANPRPMKLLTLQESPASEGKDQGRFDRSLS